MIKNIERILSIYTHNFSIFTTRSFHFLDFSSIFLPFLLLYLPIIAKLKKLKKKKISNKLIFLNFPTKFSWKRKFASLDSVRGVKEVRQRR